MSVPKFLNNVNNLIRIVDLDNTTETNRQYVGIAKAFRAMIYMDMARLFEFKKTGFSKLDDEAATYQWGIWINSPYHW